MRNCLVCRVQGPDGSGMGLQGLPVTPNTYNLVMITPKISRYNPLKCRELGLQVRLRDLEASGLQNGLLAHLKNWSMNSSFGCKRRKSF